MSASLRALLEGAIDYAGLFPPAGLAMDVAAQNYAQYLEGGDAWALGRFVVPVNRLSELAAAASDRFPRGETAAPWRLSVLIGGDALDAELATIAAFNEKHFRAGGIVPDGQHGGARIDTAEVRLRDAGDVARIADALPRWLTLYAELPAGAEPAPFVDAIRSAGARAKMRTGGVTPEAFPSSEEVARFVLACVRATVPFKATAGLHHPLRSEYRLTYETGSPTGTMHGFLNLLVASAVARDGAGEEEVAAVLEERDRGVVRFDDAGVTWRERRVGIEGLRHAHLEAANAFGSCSFTEPLDDLRQLGFL